MTQDNSLLGPLGPGITPTLSNDGDDLSKTVDELQKSISQLIDLFTKQGAGGAAGGGGDDFMAMMKELMAPQMGTVRNPLAGSTMMMGGRPSGGHVQWLGGMPPGYDDDVAKKLSIGANVGNLVSGQLGQSPGLVGGIGQLLAGLLGRGGR